MKELLENNGFFLYFHSAMGLDMSGNQESSGSLSQEEDSKWHNAKGDSERLVEEFKEYSNFV